MIARNVRILEASAYMCSRVITSIPELRNTGFRVNASTYEVSRRRHRSIIN